ncbi:MAG: SMC-Scp complex subunit ScpB [Thermoplasmata archaeon]|nr:MAG: SMC-Scp complex subunit ScpB [Thermoplasmata archaeon]
MKGDSMAKGEDEKIIESLLFSSSKPISIDDMRRITGMDGRRIRKAIENLIDIHNNSDDSPVEIIRIENKYVMQLKREYAEKAREVAEPEIPPDILKTLALIAYHQPIRQADLRKLVGPKVYEHVDFLLEKKLIISKKLGTTELLTTSNYFPEYFGIESKRPEEIREFLARRMGLKGQE